MTVFELVAKLTLDSSEYEKDLKQTEGGLSKVSSNVAKFGKVGVVAIGAVAAATTALVKKSVEAYSEYEQLAGGVEKLFGKEASKDVMKFAQEAYKTSGMSANQYMEQATSFSAALINSLGGNQKKAAQQTDVAMRAISDNFNTFGGDMQNIQNAFQGFAKQNYTMLDNLKLGYGGTKTEMERLIADANEYGKSIGMAGDLSIDSFSDIVTAIDLVQQKQGIAGTTAKEAAKTIQGSIQMTKSAWQNLVTGLADPNADVAALTKNLIESAATAAKNVIPAVQQALTGILQAVQDYAPQLIKDGVEAITKFAEGLGDGAPKIMAKITDIIVLITKALGKNAPKLIVAALKLAVGIAKGLIKGLPRIVAAMAKMAAEIIKGLNISAKVGAVVDRIKSAISDKLNAAYRIVTGWINKIKGLFPFNIGKIFSGWVPKISLRTNKTDDGASTSTTVGREGFARAMSQPYMFKRPTEFYAGEAGDELLYGRNALLKDIRDAVKGNGEVVINLNYDADADATDMLRDLARGVQRYRMAGAI